MKKKIILLALLYICSLARIANAEEIISEITLDIRVDRNSVRALDDGSYILVGDKGDRARTEDQPAYAMLVEQNGKIEWEVLEYYNDEGSSYFSGISKGADSIFVNNVHMGKDSEGEPVREFVVTEIDQTGIVTDRLLFEETIWLLPSKEGYLIRTLGRQIESASQGISAYCPILSNYSEDHTLLWQTEIDVPFVPLRLRSVDDGYYVCGSLVSFDDNGQVYSGALMKLNNKGEVLWIKQTVNDCDQYIDCAILDGGSIVVIGNSISNEAVQTGTATCYTSDGAVAWERQFLDNNVDRFYSIIETEGKGFLTVGTNLSLGASKDNFFTISYMVHDSEGNVVGQWVADLKKHSVLPSDVSLYKTKQGYSAVVSATTLDASSMVAKTVIQQIDID